MPTKRRTFLKSALAAGAVLPCDSSLEAAQSPSTQAPPPVDSGAPANAALPKVKLGKYDVSRLIIGANPFYGFSHFNRLFSQHMSEWSTAENVVKTLAMAERERRIRSRHSGVIVAPLSRAIALVLCSLICASARAGAQVGGIRTYANPIDLDYKYNFEQLNNAETAQVLGVSLAAASQRYYRALKRLKEILENLSGVRSLNHPNS